MDLQDTGCRARFLTRDRDRDGKFPGLFDAILADAGVQNQHRPHQGISNARPLKPLPPPINETDQIAHLNIRRGQRPGGIVNEYEHAA